GSRVAQFHLKTHALWLLQRSGQQARSRYGQCKRMAKRPGSDGLAMADGFQQVRIARPQYQGVVPAGQRFDQNIFHDISSSVPSSDGSPGLEMIGGIDYNS